MSSDEFELDDAALGELDAIETAYANGTALPPKSIVNRPGLVQRDLFGGTVVQPQKPPSRPGPSRAGTGGSARGGGGAGETATKVRLSKTWDPASFAKHGWSKKNAAVAKAKAKGKGKGKGRQRAYGSDEEAWDEEEVLDDDEEDDEEFLVDTTYDPNAPILPIKWPPDENAIKTFVYPVQRDKPLRTYQFNIVQRALYNNTLVSLPTGLGKTFIAACVMLNFYRWYPRGKVIFLAPTRPLVTQQIKACHYIAGIPQEDCIELTGGTIPKLRSLGWATKRVIYSTPQTVERDLAKGRLDPRDVTCIVVDEAHRATGDYSYCGVIRYMMCRNPHFRVLALTATPGSKGDAVQEVIDNLHIGRIEVRADDSIDIRQYVHKKSFDLTILPLGPHLSALRDKWGELMKQFIQPLYTAGLIWSSDPVMLAPFVVQLAYGKIKSMPGGGKGNSQYFPQIKTLMMMARAMEYLVIQSVTAFESNLKDIQSAGSKTLVDSSGFRDILRETAVLRSRAGYIGHPKMEKLRQMCLEHFKAAQDERDEYTGEKRETRVMIFCNFRAVVEEIVACLNTQWPLIKATPFVGQASSKGVRGKSQKEQLETIKKFKSGAYNVLVATSIGEEGLDIGEIDLIICYEANKSPIRMLQRVGRTGRARDGHIIVLMSAGREERNWDKANDAYNEVQNALTSGKTFDLYVDGERLLPDHVKPVCEKVEIKALPLDIEKMTMTGQSRLERRLLADEKKKEKKVRDPKANVPNDAFLGFRTAGQLAVASKSKPPTASQTMRERKSAALLDVDQEGEFRARWMFTLSGQPVHPHTFSTEDLPFDRGFTGSAHRIPSHSLRHLDLLAAMRIVDQLDDSKPEALDAWHDKHSNAFKPNLVHVFKREEGDPLPRPHPPLRRPPPSPLEEEPSLTYPALTGYPQPSSSKVPPLEPRAKDDKPLFLRLSSASASPQLLPASPSSRLSQPASPLPPPLKRRRLSLSSEIFSPPAGLTTFRAAIVKHDPGAVDDGSAAETIDLSNVLSEDDQALPPRPPPPPRPPSTNFSIELDDDDNDMIWSDSELLKGALIRGQAASRSPIALEKGKGKGKEKEQPRPVGPRKSMEIIIDDSDGEVQQQRPPPLVPPAPRKPPSKTASVLPLAKSAIPPAAAPPKPAPIAFRPFVPPRPSGGSQPKPSRRRSSPEPSVPDSVGDPGLLDDPPPPRPARARSSCSPPLVLDDDEKIADDDDYSFFDLPDDAFDACLVNIPQEAVRGRARPSAAPDEIDDSIIMPPPPPSVIRTHRKPAPSRKNRVVLDSSDQPSPAPTPNPAFRPAKSLAGPPPQPPAPMRRLAVPDTSSSSPAVPTGFRTASALLAALDRNLDADADISFGSTQAPKQLNRLRRGRQLSRGDVDNSSDPPSPPPKKRPQAAMKKKKPKKIALTHKLAAKAGIFDVEAINSDASGAEASSEDYLSENSIDRAFVAREGEDDDDDLEDSPGQAQFYRDSLATQAPPGFAPAFGAGKPRTWADPEAWRGRVGGVAGPVTPATPRSEEPSQWSYDSFCVPDDEDIEYERSSPHC